MGPGTCTPNPCAGASNDPGQNVGDDSGGDKHGGNKGG